MKEQSQSLAGFQIEKKNTKTNIKSFNFKLQPLEVKRAYSLSQGINQQQNTKKRNSKNSQQRAFRDAKNNLQSPGQNYPSQSLYTEDNVIPSQELKSRDFVFDYNPLDYQYQDEPEESYQMTAEMRQFDENTIDSQMRKILSERNEDSDDIRRRIQIMEDQQLIIYEEKKYAKYQQAHPLPDIENLPLNTDEENHQILHDTNRESKNNQATTHHNQKMPNPAYLNKLIQIVEKTRLERAIGYNDKYPCLTIRRKILILKVTMQETCGYIVRNPFFEYFTILVIIANSIVLALDDPLQINTPQYQQQIDYLFLAFYTIEMLMKVIGNGFILTKGSYLRDAWNFMDFMIIIFGFLSIFASQQINISSLRVFRVLRPLRTITKIEGLKLLVNALISALPLLRDTIIVLLFFFIIFAIAGVQLFSGYLKQRCVNVETGIPNYDLFCGYDQCPSVNLLSDGEIDPYTSKYFCGQANQNPNYGSTNFDNLLYALLIILQAVTLEGWTPIMVTLGRTISPLVVFYFIPIVFIGAFFLLNLTLAVINSKFNDAHKEQQKKQKQNKKGVKQIEDKKDITESQHIETNSIKRYLVAKRAARKMVLFMQKKKNNSPEVKGYPVDNGGENNASGQQESDSFRSNQNLLFGSNGTVDYSSRKNLSHSKTFEIDLNKYPSNSSGARRSISLLGDRKFTLRKGVIKSTILEEQEEEDVQLRQLTNRQNTYAILSQGEGDKASQGQKKQKFKLDLTKIESMLDFENCNNEIMINRDTSRVQKLIEISSRPNDQFKPNLFTTIKNANILNQIKGHINDLSKKSQLGNTDRAIDDPTQIQDFKVSSLTARIQEFELDKIIEEQEQMNQIQDQPKDYHFDDKDQSREFDSYGDFDSLLKPSSNSFKQKSIQSRIGIKQSLRRKSKFKSLISSKQSRIYQNDNDFTINSINLEELSKSSHPITIQSIFQTKEVVEEREKKNSRARLEPRIIKDEQLSSPNASVKFDAGQTISNQLFEKSESLNLQVIENQIRELNPPSDANIQNGDDPLPIPQSSRRQKKQKIHQNYDSQYVKDQLTQRSKQEQSIRQTIDERQVQSQKSIKAEKPTFKSRLMNAVNRNYHETQHPNYLATQKIDQYIQKFELKRRQKMVGFDQNNQKIVLNPQSHFKSTSEFDVFERKYINNEIKVEEDLDYPKAKQQRANSQPYKLKVLYEQNKESDDEDSSRNYKKNNKQRYDDLEPFELVGSVHHQKYLIENPIKQISKRSNFVYTGSLSIMMSKKMEEKPLYQSQQLPSSYAIQTQSITARGHNDSNNSKIQTITRKRTNNNGNIMVQSLNESVQARNFIGETQQSIPSILKKQKTRLSDGKKNQAPMTPQNFKSIAGSTNGAKQNAEKIPLFPVDKIKSEIGTLSRLIDDVQTINHFKGYQHQLHHEISEESDKEDFMKPQHIRKKGQWSGQDVMSQMNLDRADLIIEQLNDVVIFPKGIHGCIRKIRNKLKKLVMSTFFENFMTICVTINTITLGIDRYNIPDDQQKTLVYFNNVFTGVFVAELLLKIVGLGIKKYFKDKMNYLDCAVVIMSIIELGIFSYQQSTFTAFRTVRIFRVLRVARLLRQLQSMQIIIGVISRSISSFAYIALLLFLFIFIYALLGMQLFGGYYQFEDGVPRSNFDSFNSAIILTFQLLTMENWNTYIYDALRSQVNEFIVIIFFVSWIFIGNFILLNLFLAILLDSFLEEQEEEEENLTLDNQNKEDLEKERKLKLMRAKEASKKLLKVNNRHKTNGKQTLVQMLQSGIRSKTDPDGDHENNEKFEEMDENQIQQFLKRYRLVKDQDEVDLILQNIGCQRSLYIFNRDNRISFQDPLKVQKISQNLDTCFTVVFAIEAVIKAVAFGFAQDQYSYLRESWNVLDFFIVVSSLIDLIVIDVNLPAIKILRLLRTMRPLRLISKNSGIKTLVVCLLESIGHIINVVIVLLIVWLMFAILGVSLYSGKFFYCTRNPYTNHDESQCEKDKGIWSIYNSNFDDVPNALETLFIISTFENWITIMYQAIDSGSQVTGPEKDSSPFSAYYFICFILIGTYFFLNFFIGVLFLNFKYAQKNEQGDFKEEELHWIDMQKMIIKTKPDYETIDVPKQKFRLWVHSMVTKNSFDYFIMACIILNMIQMAVYYEGASKDFIFLLDIINYIFTIIFLFEAMSKIIAFGQRYFQQNWNKFDFFVVTASILDIILNLLNNINSRFLRIGPQLARVLRVLRISRLFRLIGKSKGLQALIQTIAFSLPPLFNVFSLLMIMFFIYAVLGVFLFGDAENGNVINSEFMNFKNFGNAMVLLLRILTGEDWNSAMFDVSRNVDHYIAGIYFISFRLIGSDVMLNLFILIILQQFDQYYLPQDNVIQKFKDNLEYFKQTWKQYSIKYGGLKIREGLLIKYFQSMNEPLGMPDKDEKEINKEIIKMGIRSEDGWVFFNELLYRSMKRVYGDKDFQSDIMRITEFQTLFKIHQMNQTLIGKKSFFKKKVNQYKDMALNKQSCNPFQQLYYYQLSFKVWKEFACEKQRNMSMKTTKQQKDDNDYYEHINDYISRFREDDPSYIQKEINYTYESEYISCDETETEEIQYQSLRRSMSKNPMIVIDKSGNQVHPRQSLEEVSEEKSADLQMTIQSQIQLKGVLNRRESHNLLLKTGSQALIIDKKSAQKNKNFSLASRQSKSKSFIEMNESSSNNEANSKQYKVKSDLLKIQSEINIDLSQNNKEGNTPSNGDFDKLLGYDDNISPRFRFRKYKNNSDAHIQVKQEEKHQQFSQ